MHTGIRPKKRLGQHFLKDENIAKKIIACLVYSTGLIVEVGPGTGSLTKHLLKEYGNRLWLVEVDDEAIGFLNEAFPNLKERILHADFLTLDLNSAFNGSDLSVIGNFPYNISSQILFNIIKHRSQVTQMVGMFQKEVAKRICSPPGNKDYGILSVLVQAYYNAQYLFDVSPAVFYPPPNVYSGVIQLNRKEKFTLNCDEEMFVKVVKTGFNQRRKKLSNALSGLIGGKAVKNELLDKRAEQLSWQNFVQLTQILEGT